MPVIKGYPIQWGDVGIPDVHHVLRVVPAEFDFNVEQPLKVFYQERRESSFQRQTSKLLDLIKL